MVGLNFLFATGLRISEDDVEGLLSFIGVFFL
jgi:hypothetical protein